MFNLQSKMINVYVIYLGNTQQALKKIMGGHFSDILRILKKGQKSYSFVAQVSITLRLLCHIHIYLSS